MKISKTETGTNGITAYFTADTTRGVPYCSVFVNEAGDYWFTVYGSLSFGRSDHTRILEEIKPAGKNITAQKHFKK